MIKNDGKHVETVKMIQKLELQQGGQALRMDMDVLLDDVYAQPGLPEAVKQALSGAVSWQQRSETTLARFLAGPSQFPALVLALLVCDTLVLTDSAQQGMDMHDYFLARDRQEPMALVVPVVVPGRKLSAARVGLTPTGEGIVLAAAAVTIEDGLVKNARLALNGVWKKKQWMSVAADKLVGAPLSDERIQSVVTVIMTEVDPPSDHLGSAAYRRAMAGVMTCQVLEACR
jgi:CO/xanthine dehydrogenase FAD-binding subunit